MPEEQTDPPTRQSMWHRWVLAGVAAILLASVAAYLLAPSTERFSSARALADRLADLGVPCDTFEAVPDPTIGWCRMKDGSSVGIVTADPTTSSERDAIMVKSGNGAADYGVVFGDNWTMAGVGNQEYLRKVADLFGADFRTGR